MLDMQRVGSRSLDGSSLSLPSVSSAGDPRASVSFRAVSDGGQQEASRSGRNSAGAIEPCLQTKAATDRLKMELCSHIHNLMSLNEVSGQQRSACRALQTLATEDNPGCQASRHLPDVDAILPFIRLLECGSPAVQEHAAGALASLSGIVGPGGASAQIQAAANGAIPALVYLLSSTSRPVVEQAAGALASLARDAMSHDVMAASGAVARLAQQLLPAATPVGKTSSYVAEQAARMLYLMTSSARPGMLDRIAAAGAISPLVQFLSLPTSSHAPSAREFATGALASMTASAGAKAKVVAAGGVPPLVKMMQSKSEKIQALAVFAVRNIAKEAKNVARLAEAGAIFHLARLIESPSPEIKRHAVWALAHVTGSAENQVKAAAAGAVPPLVALLGAGAWDPEVQHAAAWAVGNLSKNPAVKVQLVALGAQLSLAPGIAGF